MSGQARKPEKTDFICSFIACSRSRILICFVDVQRLYVSRFLANTTNSKPGFELQGADVVDKKENQFFQDPAGLGADG